MQKRSKSVKVQRPRLGAQLLILHPLPAFFLAHSEILINSGALTSKPFAKKALQDVTRAFPEGFTTKSAQRDGLPSKSQFQDELNN